MVEKRKACAFWVVVGVLIADGVIGLIINAPEKCGGQHVVTHASALFGPTPSTSGINDISIFAPSPKADGKASIDDLSEKYRSVNQYEAALLRLINASESLWSSVIASRALFAKPNTSGKKKPEIELLTNGCDEWKRKEEVEGVKGKVAVVIQGECEFGTKVFNLQKLKAVGVIVVADDASGGHLGNMDLNHSKANLDVEIPSVMITYRDWKQLAPCRYSNMSVSFTRDGEAAFDIDYGKDVLTWSMMRAIALWILLQCGVNAVRYKTRHNDLTARAQAIAILPSSTYVRVRGEEMEEDPAADDGRTDNDPLCAICLEGFQDGDQIRRLECSHLYHKTCIDPWLMQSSSCPVCKRDVANLPPPLPSHFYGSVSAV